MNEILLTINLLKKSVRMAYEQDFELLERNRPMEREFVAKVVTYMQIILQREEEFSCLRSYNLDSEYHTNMNDVKSTPHFLNGTRPDLILHKRRSNDFNNLVAEFKAKNGDNTDDIVKLKDFTDPNGQYQYQIGVSVILNTDAPKYTFVQDGNVVSEPTENN